MLELTEREKLEMTALLVVKYFSLIIIIYKTSIEPILEFAVQLYE